MYIANNGSSGDEDVVRRIRTEMAGWQPRRGANWADLMERAEGTRQRAVYHGRVLVYSMSTAALVAILVLAAVAMSSLDLGPLAGGGVVNSTTTSLP